MITGRTPKNLSSEIRRVYDMFIQTNILGEHDLVDILLEIRKQETQTELSTLENMCQVGNQYQQLSNQWGRVLPKCLIYYVIYFG